MKIDNNKNLFLYQYSKKDINEAMKACELDLDASLSYIKEFEKKYSFFQKVKYVLACASGTSAMLEALWACGVGEDTEVIVPAMTYWASAFQAFSLGAKVKYVDIEPNSLCIDPKQIENEITKKNKSDSCRSFVRSSLRHG